MFLGGMHNYERYWHVFLFPQLMLVADYTGLIDWVCSCFLYFILVTKISNNCPHIFPKGLFKHTSEAIWTCSFSTEKYIHVFLYCWCRSTLIFLLVTSSMLYFSSVSSHLGYSMNNHISFPESLSFSSNGLAMTIIAILLFYVNYNYFVYFCRQEVYQLYQSIIKLAIGSIGFFV